MCSHFTISSPVCIGVVESYVNADDIWHTRLLFNTLYNHASDGSVQCVIGIRNHETTVEHVCTHLYAVQPMILHPLPAGSVFVVFHLWAHRLGSVRTHTHSLLLYNVIRTFCVCMHGCACVCTCVCASFNAFSLAGKVQTVSLPLNATPWQPYYCCSLLPRPLLPYMVRLCCEQLPMHVIVYEFLSQVVCR